jgi:hypothetical protein
MTVVSTEDIDTHAEHARRDAIKTEIIALVGRQPQCGSELADNIDDVSDQLVRQLADELAEDGKIAALDADKHERRGYYACEHDIPACPECDSNQLRNVTGKRDTNHRHNRCKECGSHFENPVFRPRRADYTPKKKLVTAALEADPSEVPADD